MISVSILDMDIDDMFVQKIYNLEEAGITSFHIDMMDGKYVEKDNIASMKKKVQLLSGISIMKKEAHLMTYDVLEYCKFLKDYGIDSITIHRDAVEDIMDIITSMKDMGIQVGIAIKPDEDVSEIYDILKYLSKVIIMSVEPGKGGQKFLESSISKISELKDEISRQNLDTIIQVDGGITDENISKVFDAGADSVVIGTYIVSKASDLNSLISTVEELKSLY